jgi:hypothetical protein
MAPILSAAWRGRARPVRAACCYAAAAGQGEAGRGMCALPGRAASALLAAAWRGGGQPGRGVAAAGGRGGAGTTKQL